MTNLLFFLLFCYFVISFEKNICMDTVKINTKKNLNANNLIELLREEFSSINDTRDANKSIELIDILMSAYAIFSLKHPSLLSFRNQYLEDKENLESIYQIKKVPSDNEMREVIDEIETADIQSIFKIFFKILQRGKELKKYLFMEKYYLVSCDGTEYFQSKKICCKNCMVRNLKNGVTENYHQFYGAAIVHPDIKQVIPLSPEPIIRQDGSKKNDCERNASKRWIANFRKSHPKLSVIIIEDALASNAPHIKELIKHDLRFILGAKESDHKYLFEYISVEKKLGNVIEHTIIEDKKTHIFSFANNVPLNESNKNLLVNFVEYWEVNNKTNKIQHFSWVTDIKIKTGNVYDIMLGGRARWKIENETFNTLKNQGYHFTHNYGHGKKNLSVNLAVIMMLAFLIDQMLELSCNLFQGALKKKGARIRLWENVRSLFNEYLFDSMNQIYEAIIFGHKKSKIEILNSS